MNADERIRSLSASICVHPRPRAPRRRRWCLQWRGSFGWPAGVPWSAALFADLLHEWNNVGLRKAEFLSASPAVSVRVLPPYLALVMAQRFPYKLTHRAALSLRELLGPGQHLWGQGDRQGPAHPHTRIVAHDFALLCNIRAAAWATRAVLKRSEERRVGKEGRV